MSRAPSNLISLDDIDAALNDPTTQEPVARQDLPIYQGRGGIRKDAKDAMRPYATSLLEEAWGAATSFLPLPKWYTDFGGSVLKSVEGFAGSVGQFVGDVASTATGGLIDLTGSSVDKSRAYDLLRSDDPELRVQGQRLIDQARTVEDATREGFRLEMQRNRETPLPGVDPDSWASTAGNIVGSVAPSIAALVPGMQAPVIAGYFSNSYESAYDQYADTKIAQTGGYDTTTAATVGVISGAIEAAMEFLPIMGIKKASAAARQALVESAMSGSANWRAQAAKQVAKLVGLGAAQEGAEEGTTELAGEILRLTYDEQLREKYKNDPTTAALEAAERITKAALAGAVGGGLLGGAGFGTALAGSESGVQPTTPTAAPQSTQAAPDTEPLPMIEVEPEAGVEAPVASGEVDTGPSVPLTEEDESIKAQAKAWNAANVGRELGLNEDESAAVIALGRAMGLDESRLRVGSGSARDGRSSSLEQPAWHGSPHTFSPESLVEINGKRKYVPMGSEPDGANVIARFPNGRFDIGKIGTGEGAQAFGWGLYFAGDKDVARYYRDTLGGGKRWKYKGVDLKSHRDLTTEQSAAQAVIDGMRGGRLSFSESVLANLSVERERLHQLVEDARGEWETGGDADEFPEISHAEDAIAALESLKESDFTFDSSGRIYGVELAPKDDEWLDWDKQHYDQSGKIQDILDAISKEMSYVYQRHHFSSGDGREIYKKLIRATGDQETASRFLRDRGIRGIRFLDGNSRAAGFGNSNYVVFDDSDVVITSLEQKSGGVARGSVEFTKAGTAIIRGLSSPDVSTGVHELAHVARRWLFDRSLPASERSGISDADISAAEEWCGASDGKWSVEAEERFASGFERYLLDGIAPSSGLKSLFAKLGKWMATIYKSIVGTPLESKLSDGMRKALDRLVQRGGVATAGSSDLMQAAFGMRNVEVGKAGRETMRVARPEAIAALRAAGKIPTTQDPFDFMHEVASEPDRYAEFIDTLRANPDMSRGQADALFGEENAKTLFENVEGESAQRISAKERRKIWVESTLELADSNALGIGPSPQSNVPLPPESAGKGRPAQPADNRIVFADDVWTRFQESQLDELEKLVKLQNAVLAETGAKELPDRDNPEMALRLAKSKRRYEQERFHNGPNGAIPTLREMAEKRITPWRVGRLAAALHAEEANQQVAKLNPDDPTVGYGLSNDEAQRIIAQEVAAPDSALVFKFAAWLSEIPEKRTSLDAVAGVISARDVAQMRAVYSSFVTTQDDPDFVDHDADVAGMSSMPRNAYSVAVSQRLNRLGRAYGSLDDPDNPRARALFDGMFAHTIEAYERGILRRSQNNVLNTLRRFADRTQDVQSGLTVRFEPPIVRKMNRATGEVETDKEALAAYKARPDVLYGKLDEEVTLGNGATLLPGTPFFIEVANKELADTLKTVKTEGALQAAILGALRAGAGMTRFFATSILNPAFAPAGLARDLQTAISTIATEHDDLEKAKRDYVKGVPQSFAAVLRSVVGKPGTGEFDRYYEEMKAAGGTQEMFAMSDFDKSKAVVKSVIEPNILTRSKDAFDTFVDMTSRLTKPTEDGARLSFYVLARKRGWTPEKAALAARKLTIDFQIHGKDTRTLRAGWAFLNASVQGQRKIVRMLRTPTGKRIAGMYFLAGFINAVASYLVLDDDENKDGKPDSAQIPPWERDTYIRIPGLGVQIPTMWGMQPALSAGWWMGEAFAATMGKADVDHAANAAAFGNAILDGFNPAGGSDAFSVNGLANLVFPSIADPFVQSAMNKDWRGNQIANAPIGRKQALTWVDSQHPFETTPEMFVSAAQAMNRWTGGDESTSGFVDVAPETIRHVVSSLFGGGYRTLEKIGGVVGAPYTGDLKTWMDLPIVDTFTTKTPDPKAVNAEYAKYEDISTRYLARIKAYEDSNNFEALRAFLSESDDLAMMSMIVEPTRKNIESMREMLRETDDAGIRRSLLESIQREREAAMGLIRSGLRRR